MTQPADSVCPHCADTGELRWQQPTTGGPDGQAVLRELTHPCPAGCGPGWRHPAAEQHRVVDQASDVPALPPDAQQPATRPRGQADAAQQLPDQFADILAAAIRQAGGTVYGDTPRRTP
jgi:hypothetical protein